MTGTKSIDKALTVLKQLLASEGEVRVEQLSDQLEMPQATLYRHITALERNGLLWRRHRSFFSPGVFLLQQFDREQLHTFLTQQARSIVSRLSERLKLTAHLGVFDEDMVTYLVKEEVGDGDVFTRETTQLDAYCSGLGKVLLAGLSADKLDSYFAAGALPVLTADTITEERKLRKEILTVGKQGYAIDNEEFEEGLFCIAMPIVDRDQRVLAALSVSSHSPEHMGKRRKKVVKALREASKNIEQALYSNA